MGCGASKTAIPPGETGRRRGGLVNALEESGDSSSETDRDDLEGAIGGEAEAISRGDRTLLDLLQVEDLESPRPGSGRRRPGMVRSITFHSSRQQVLEEEVKRHMELASRVRAQNELFSSETPRPTRLVGSQISTQKDRTVIRNATSISPVKRHEKLSDPSVRCESPLRSEVDFDRSDLILREEGSSDSSKALPADEFTECVWKELSEGHPEVLGIGDAEATAKRCVHRGKHKLIRLRYKDAKVFFDKALIALPALEDSKLFMASALDASQLAPLQAPLVPAKTALPGLKKSPPIPKFVIPPREPAELETVPIPPTSPFSAGLRNKHMSTGDLTRLEDARRYL